MDSESSNSTPSQNVPPPQEIPQQVPPHQPPPPVYTQHVSMSPHRPSGTDKIWAMVSHLSALLGLGFGFFIVPLVVYLAMKDESEYTACNAKEALNFHISLLIYVLCCIPLTFIVIGIPLLVMIGLAGLILAIIATIKASDGHCYRYPLTIRFVS